MADETVEIIAILLGGGGLSAIISHYLTIRIETRKREEDRKGLEEKLKEELHSNVLSTIEHRTKNIMDDLQNQIIILRNDQVRSTEKIDAYRNELNEKQRVINTLQLRVERMETCRRVNEHCPLKQFEEKPEGELNDVSGLIHLAKKNNSEIPRPRRRNPGVKVKNT